MEQALAEYVRMEGEGSKLVEADWSKVRALDFREALGKRDELAAQLAFFAVEVDAEEFAESVSDTLSSPTLFCFPLFSWFVQASSRDAVQYAILHSERILEDKIAGYGIPSNVDKIVQR